jgi:GR25 family glycosyltransferase involved in LPS biosynthesis
MEALPARTRPLPTAFVINLDRDTVRLTHMEAECARVGIPMQRWPAMLGAALPPALASSFVAPTSGTAWSLSSGEIGCYASHVTIWQALVDGALGDKVFGDAALVMEDDLRLEDDFVPAIQKTLAVAPSGWDLIRLSNAPRRAFVPVAARHRSRCHWLGRSSLFQFARQCLVEKMAVGGRNHITSDRDGVGRLGCHNSFAGDAVRPTAPMDLVD